MHGTQVMATVEMLVQPNAHALFIHRKKAKTDRGRPIDMVQPSAEMLLHIRTEGSHRPTKDIEAHFLA